MNHTLAVGVRDRIGNLPGQLGCLGGSQRAILQKTGQTRTFDKGHGKVMLLILLSHLKNWNDPWVIETGCRLRFDEETLDILLAGRLSGTDHLDRDDAVQANLSRLVDDSHATAGDLLDEFVLAEASMHSTRRRLVFRLSCCRSE